MAKDPLAAKTESSDLPPGKIKEIELEGALEKCLRYANNGNGCRGCPDWIKEEIDCPKLFKEAKSMRELPDWIEEKLNNGENIPGVSKRERKALKMFYFEGRKNPQIADALDISEAYVSQFKSRAIEKAEEAREKNHKEDQAEVAASEDGNEKLKEVSAPEEAKAESKEPDLVTEMLLLLINGEETVRVHPKSDTSKLREVLEKAGVEAEIYEKVS